MSDTKKEQSLLSDLLSLPKGALSAAATWLFTGPAKKDDITQDGSMMTSSSDPAYLKSMNKKLDGIDALLPVLQELQESKRQVEIGKLANKIPLVQSDTKEGACIAGEARFMTPSEGLLLFVGAEEFEKDLQIHDYTKMNLTDAQMRALDGHDVVIAYGKDKNAKLYDLGATQGKSWDDRTKAMVEKAKSLGKDGICR